MPECLKQIKIEFILFTGKPLTWKCSDVKGTVSTFFDPPKIIIKYNSKNYYSIISLRMVIL